MYHAYGYHFHVLSVAVETSGEQEVGMCRLFAQWLLVQLKRLGSIETVVVEVPHGAIRGWFSRNRIKADMFWVEQWDISVHNHGTGKNGKNDKSITSLTTLQL